MFLLYFRHTFTAQVKYLTHQCIWGGKGSLEVTNYCYKVHDTQYLDVLSVIHDIALCSQC